MKRIVYLLIVIILIFAAFPGNCFAAQDGDYPFTVKIIPPSNNIGNIDYYHIPGTPGEKITLQAIVKNISDKEIQIDSEQLNAFSGPDGIFYESPDKVDAETYSMTDAKYGLANCIAVEDTIDLKPGESKTVNIDVTVPDVSSGTVLGGIGFVVFAGTQKVQADKTENNDTQILINENLRRYAAIQIDLSGQVQSSVNIGNLTFDANNLNVCVPVINQAAKIEGSVSADYQLEDSKGNPLYEGNIGISRMAPMTQYMYRIPWGKTAIENGAYTLYAKIHADGKEYDSEETLTIGSEIAAKAVEKQKEIETQNNTETTNTQTDMGSFRIMFLIILSVILLVFAVFIYRSYKNKRRGTGRTSYV